MALIEYDEYKQRLRDLGPELEKLSAALDMDSARAEARKLEDETAQARASGTTWSDPRRCSSASSSCRTRSPARTSWVTEWQDLTALCEMGPGGGG